MIRLVVIGMALSLALLGAGPAEAGERSWTARWTDEEITALSDALSEAWTHGLN